MKLSLYIGAGAIMLAGCAHGPAGLSSDEYQAMKRFGTVFQMATESRDADPVVFEARYVEAAQASADVMAAVRSHSDVDAGTEASSCVSFLKNYRDSISLGDAGLTKRAAGALLGCERSISRFTKD